jgi:hypothetical protein
MDVDVNQNVVASGYGIDPMITYLFFAYFSNATKSFAWGRNMVNTGGNYISALQFSSDGSIVYTLFGNPQYMLIQWASNGAAIRNIAFSSSSLGYYFGLKIDSNDDVYIIQNANSISLMA